MTTFHSSLISIAMFHCVAVPTMADTITNYVAVLENGNVTKNGASASSAAGTGIARFVLTEPSDTTQGPTLSYEIELQDSDIDGLQTVGVTADDVTAIHLHDLNKLPDGSPNTLSDTAGTLHVLNIFGVPRGGDDPDMQFDAAAHMITGLWDNGDATPTIAMAPSFELSGSLAELMAGELFLMVHTTEFTGGAFGGPIVQIPEPASIVPGIIGLLCLLAPNGICWCRRSI